MSDNKFSEVTNVLSSIKYVSICSENYSSMFYLMIPFVKITKPYFKGSTSDSV